MALVVSSRVQETTTSTGTGTITLTGAVTQFQSFSAGIGDGNSTYYLIADQSGNNWEEGLGTYTASNNTLTRSSALVTASSNNNNIVNFTSGTKNVFVTYPSKSSTIASVYTYPTSTPALNLDFLKSNKLDPRITFSRPTTNTTFIGTATYYDGITTALAEQNLFLNSVLNGGTNWTSSSSTTITYNVNTAPDGTTTAALVIPSTDAGISHRFYQNAGTTAVQQTVSIYVQPAGYTNFQICTGTGSVNAVYDLSAVTATNVVGCSNVAISSAGSNWYRCSATFIGDINNAITFQPYPSSGYVSSNAGNQYAGDGVSGVYVWGPQCTQKPVATLYTPTTTSKVSNYISQLMTAPANVPRFDYNPTTGEPLGLLIEESRTNLLISPSNSKYPVNPTGAGTNPPTITSPTTELMTLPDGSIDVCSKVVFPSSGDSRARILVAGVFSGSYSGSVYYKIPGYVSGWKYFSGTVTVSATNMYLEVSASSFDGQTLYGKTVYFTFGQIEAGTFSTSYIPTKGSSVTRVADTTKISGNNFSSWYNNNQGSFYLELDTLNSASGSINRFLSVDTRFFEVCCNGLTPLKFSIYNLFGSSTLTSSVQISSVANTVYKIATTYNSSNNNLYLFVNNNYNSLSQSNPIGLNPTSIGIGLQISATTRYMTGHIRKLVYYPTILSQSNLQALTTNI